MSHDWIFAVDNGGVVTSLIEHTRIYTEDAGKIDGTVQSSLVRADD